VGDFSARGSCRCWIWLMMGLVVLTFVMMVLTMRLFSKKFPAPVYESVTVTPAPAIKAEL
jgi:flagellar basal body-associated protein FliL